MSLLQPYQDVAPALSRRHCSNLIKTSLLQSNQVVIAPNLSWRHCSNLIKTSMIQDVLLQPYQDVIAPPLSRRHCSNLIKTSLLQPYQDVIAPTNLIKTSLLQPYQDLIAPNLSDIAPTLSRRHCSNFIKTYCSNLIKKSLLQPYQDLLLQPYQDVIAPALSRRHCSNLIKMSLLQPYQDVIPALSRRHCSSLIKTSLLQPYQDCDSKRLDEVVSGDETCVWLNESVRKTHTNDWEDSALIATPRHLSPEPTRAKKKPHWQIAQGHTTTHLLTGRRFPSKSALGTAIYQCLSSIPNIEYRVQNLYCLWITYKIAPPFISVSLAYTI